MPVRASDPSCRHGPTSTPGLPPPDSVLSAVLHMEENGPRTYLDEGNWQRVAVLKHGCTNGECTAGQPAFQGEGTHVWDLDSLNILDRTHATAADKPVIMTKLPIKPLLCQQDRFANLPERNNPHLLELRRRE